MLEDENKLIKEAQKGESDCFGRLYDHYIPQIYRFVLMKINHHQEAEDLVHDVFLSAWQNIDSYSHQGFPFSSWLYQIARNKVIDYYRLKKSTIQLDNIDESFVKIASAVEHNLDANLDIGRIYGTLNQLTPDQKDVIIMRFIEDLSHQEISAAMGRSEGAIRLLQHRAINTLKDLLNNNERGNIN